MGVQASQYGASLPTAPTANVGDEADDAEDAARCTQAGRPRR